MHETVTIIVAVVVVVAVAIAARRRRGAEKLDVYYDMSDGERYPHRWGFTDTRFEFDGPSSVRVTGTRYPLSGYSMPYFIPFVEEVLQVPITPDEVMPELEHRAVPEARSNEAFAAALERVLSDGQISMDAEDRLIHSHGQLSVDEIYRLLYEGPLARLVDLVLYPDGEEDVRAIVRLADEHGVCLIPYGGGTNVSAALTCPPGEERVIASVDMRRMSRILWLDEENLQACVEAGISGKLLERELGARGYTSGHDPDSLELATLGGWISTNASGMKKNQYGNIEDIVITATLITPTGDIESIGATPRNSIGIEPRVLLFGSEGGLGIITKAIIKIHPVPQIRRYGSLVFPSFERGVEFLRQLRRGGVLPASIRLVNNFEFRFGQALKPAPGPVKHILGSLQKFYLLKLRRFKPLEISACTIVMEGSREEVAHQKRVIFATAKKHGAISAGAKNGKRGYTLTFGIAYIRDFLSQFHVLGETFETSVPWDRIHQVCRAARETLVEECRRYSVRGMPYLSYRVTQTYHTGVCIYFTMGFSGKGLKDPAQVYHDIEHRIRQVVLDNGGALSHHHGIGKIRQGFLSQVQTENSINVIRATKRAMDPRNIFGAGNGVFADPPPTATKSDS
jgi:alkyldihydroxyacetonephosphate synthase